MFEMFNKSKTEQYTSNVLAYIEKVYVSQAPNPNVRYSRDLFGENYKKEKLPLGGKIIIKHSEYDGPPKVEVKTVIPDKPIEESKPTEENIEDSGIRYCRRRPYEEEASLDDLFPSLDDVYDSDDVAHSFKQAGLFSSHQSILEALDKNTNKTFVDALAFYIKRKGVKDSQVYRAAGVDRRLFSKIMSDRHYSPSKDTAIALSLALKLTLEEANDMLSRAGYSLSHSSKKDIVVEYFFREQVYSVVDLNIVLNNLNEKIIGR